jgi:biopolymer transport protein ExbB
MNLVEFFDRGGPLMWVLLACSVVSIAIIAERVVVYLWYGLRPDAWMDRVLVELRAGRIDVVKSMAEKYRHPVATIVTAYLSRLSAPSGIRKEAVLREGSIALERVEARLRILAAIAHLAPLLGLLGTVLGMVVAFSEIQALQGTVKPSDLAGGIWEALLTTVFGLIVAIPAMAAFHAFESHADKIARRMEMVSGSIDEVLGVVPGCAMGVPDRAAAAPTDDWNTVS